MKGSKEFNNILDECLERLLEGETIEQCLQSYPEQAAELEPLLRTALAVKEVSIIQPRAEFKVRARYQFRSALQEMESKRGYRFFGWQSRWATAVTAVLIFLLVGGGTVAAAGNSMPDETLYPVKLTTERVRLALTPSALGKAELYAKLADKRVAEIIYVASKGDPKRVELVTQRLDAHLAMLPRLAALQPERGGAVLAPRQAPEPAREEAKVLAPAPKKVRKGTKDVHPQVSRRDKIRVIVRRCAMDNPARLRAALKTAPESVKPALRRAIKVSAAGYEKVLESLD